MVQFTNTLLASIVAASAIAPVLSIPVYGTTESSNMEARGPIRRPTPSGPIRPNPADQKRRKRSVERDDELAARGPPIRRPIPNPADQKRRKRDVEELDARSPIRRPGPPGPVRPNPADQKHRKRSVELEDELAARGPRIRRPLPNPADQKRRKRDVEELDARGPPIRRPLPNPADQKRRKRDMDVEDELEARGPPFPRPGPPRPNPADGKRRKRSVEFDEEFEAREVYDELD